MEAQKKTKRKPVSAARIELDLWFDSNDAFQRFGKVTFGRMSKSITEREWVSAAWEYENDPTGGVDAVFRFTHTCRNSGAQRSDSQKFFNATCHAAGLRIDAGGETQAGLLDVRLLNRETVAP